MRIALVHSFYGSGQPSGENTVVTEQATELRNRGHTVALIGRRTDDLAGAPWYRVLSAATAATGVGPSPASFLSEFQPDVIHLHNTFPNFGTRWLQKWHLKTVATVHNYRSACAAGTFHRDGRNCTDCLDRIPIPAVLHGCYRGSRLQTIPVAIGASAAGGIRKTVSMPAQLIALNDEMATYLEHVSGQPIHVIPNFVRSSDVREAIGDRWAFVGRLAAEKGLQKLISSWPTDQQLHIFGDGPLAPLLTKLVAEGGNVVWHGQLPRDEVLEQLSSMRGLIVPSVWSEGLPTVILESLARGVPLILSDQMSATRGLVEAGVAISVPVASTDLRQRLTVAMRRIAQSGAQLRRDAAAFHRAEYSPGAWYSQVVPIYENIAAIP